MVYYKLGIIMNSVFLSDVSSIPLPTHMARKEKV
jgi:hypothetical protein